MLYFLELEKPLGSTKHSASVYLGYTKNEHTLEKRINNYHRTGRGASFTKAAYEKNIKMNLACVIEGDKNLERKIKNCKNNRREMKKYLKQIARNPELANNLERLLRLINNA